jgi:hypothetical protein
MKLALTPEQAFFAGTTRQFLDGKCPTSLLRELRSDPRNAVSERPGGLETVRKVGGFSFFVSYAMSGYAVGIRYLVHMYQTMGFTKAQVLEGLAVASGRACCWPGRSA